MLCFFAESATFAQPPQPLLNTRLGDPLSGKSWRQLIHPNMLIKIHSFTGRFTAYA